jgi:hypothetical protein
VQVFIKQLLERAHITADVFRREEYKAAATPLTNEAYDEPQRANMTALLEVGVWWWCGGKRGGGKWGGGGGQLAGGQHGWQHGWGCCGLGCDGARVSGGVREHKEGLCRRVAKKGGCKE